MVVGGNRGEDGPPLGEPVAPFEELGLNGEAGIGICLLGAGIGRDAQIDGDVELLAHFKTLLSLQTDVGDGKA